MFLFFLILAHLQALLFPIFVGIKSINQFKKFKNHILIPFGFIFLGLASMFEMIDHTKTNWVYVNHSSLFNWLFYTFLALGLTSLSTSVIKNKFAIGTNIFLCFCSIVSYFLVDKTIALSFQVIISIFLIINWQRIFKDWILIAYPIFGIFFTTFFGANLSITGDQIWHIFIGPSGTISTITFYLVLKRSNNKLPKILL
ncbi:possible 7TM chemoreceptor [Prochlorococcus marinus str. MIT 9515]|uniref:Possible 7TM chemoreceptor n=1 Tax=Prochlorococcus marinus (strain MIT 9515) TaxID=167542 RepID=A2BVW8_PROM5|nr:hypothetical protein [Prochlorococcus marinus]ABM71929.1 possible 7TM chemoreceptor [Prochlorococcus marinus str. MIT 9515]